MVAESEDGQVEKGGGASKELFNLVLLIWWLLQVFDGGRDKLMIDLELWTGVLLVERKVSN